MNVERHIIMLNTSNKISVKLYTNDFANKGDVYYFIDIF